MKRLLSGILLLAAFGWCACNPVLFFPDRASAPGLKERGEAHMLLSVKPQSVSSQDSLYHVGSSYSSAFDVAVSPLNHLGLAASYRAVNDRQVAEDPDAFLFRQYGGVFRGDRWEVSAGYYTLTAERRLYEVYAGYSQGRLSRRGVLQPYRDFEAAYRQYSIQPTIGQVFSNGALVQSGLRLAAQQVTAIDGPNPNIAYDVDLQGHDQSVLRTPSILFSGFVNASYPVWLLLLNAQAGFAGVLAGPQVREGLPFYLSVGVGFRFRPGILKETPFGDGKGAF